MLCPHHVVATLSSSQYQPWVRHVVTQIHVSTPAQDTPTFWQWDVGLYGDRIGSDYWPIRSTLALDLPTFSISA